MSAAFCRFFAGSSVRCRSVAASNNRTRRQHVPLMRNPLPWGSTQGRAWITRPDRGIFDHQTRFKVWFATCSPASRVMFPKQAHLRRERCVWCQSRLTCVVSAALGTKAGSPASRARRLVLLCRKKRWVSVGCREQRPGPQATC